MAELSRKEKQSKTNLTDRYTIHVLPPARSALGPIEATADGEAKYNGKRSKTSHHDRNQARKRLKQAACAMFHGDSIYTDETPRGTTCRGNDTEQTVDPDETPTGTECMGNLKPCYVKAN